MSSAPARRTLQVLLRLIAPGPPQAPGTGELDWLGLDRLARESHVTSALWLRLRNDALLEQVPPALADGLRAAHAENVRRNRLLKAQILETARRLNQAGQVPLLLKGAAYLFDPPLGNAALRYLHDLDLLAADSGACQRALLAAGFRDLGKIARPRAEARYHHWPALVDPASGLEVEVHKRPFITADAAMTRLHLAEAVPREMEGARLLLPSRACRIAGMVIHAQVSDRGFGRAWFNPRYLREFAEYALAWPAEDWRRAEATAAGNRVAFGNFRHLAEQLMGARPPLARPTRRIDRLQLARIRRHDDFAPRDGLAGRALAKLGLLKDRARRRWGDWVGWRSVPRWRLEEAEGGG
jgi:hypothetical protein